MTDCLVDGVATDRVPVDDRALKYGDGLFETLACFDRHMPLWTLHMARLETGARRLGLPSPDEQALRRDCERLAAAGGDCVLRLTWSRGSGGRAYAPPLSAPARRIVQRLPLSPAADRLHLITSGIRLARQPALAGLKHLNRLEQVLAAREAQAAGLEEALMLDEAGHAIEAITGNLVVVTAAGLRTPGTDACGVTGVGLTWLRGVMPEIETAPIEAATLVEADELVVINSVRGPRPVISLDGRAMPAGPVFCKMQSHWQEMTGKTC